MNIDDDALQEAIMNYLMDLPIKEIVQYAGDMVYSTMLEESLEVRTEFIATYTELPKEFH